jgi:hypothetical protein
MEIWKDIQGYEGLYQVSSLGKVKSIDRYVKHNSGSKMLIKSVVMHPSISCGYKRISLCKEGKYKSFQVHRLLAIEFIPNPKNKPCINHKDGIKLNNDLSNLEWNTYAENNQHAYNKGLKIGASIGKNGILNPTSKVVLQLDNDTGEILNKFYGTHEAARELNLEFSLIAATCRGKNKTHKGYSFVYENNYKNTMK